MKTKSLIIVIILLFCTTLLTTIPMYASTTDVPKIKYGDLNNDSQCDTTDLSILNGYLIGKIERPEDPEKIQVADLNNDSKIDSTDYAILQKYLLGLINSLPYVKPSNTVKPSDTPKPTNLNLEIERKYWIKVDKIPYDLTKFDKYELTQAYVCFSPEVRVRKANTDMYFLCIKAPVDTQGLVREEHEYYIAETEYLNLLKKTEGNVIYKDRYQGWVDNRIYAIDIYSGMFKGLAVLEINFESEEEANNYTPPSWVEKDVTSDKRFKNGNLAKYGLQDIKLD